LLTIVLVTQAVILVVSWLKYRHQLSIDERIGRMERILEIADNVLFNQRRFLPMMTAVADIHESVCGRSQLSEGLRGEAVVKDWADDVDR
jgi:hypothetical protein